MKLRNLDIEFPGEKGSGWTKQNYNFSQSTKPPKRVIILSMRKRKIFIIFAAIVIFTCFMPDTAYAIDGNIFYAKILEEETTTEHDEELGDFIVQKLLIEVYSKGNFKGRTYTIENRFSDGSYNDFSLYRAGEKIKVEVYISEEGYVLQSEIYNVVRYNYLIWILALFFVMLVVIGRMKGLKTIVSLAVTVALVVLVMLPLLKKGYPPMPIVIGVCVAVTAVTFVIMSGPNRKALAAIAGTVSGLISAGIIAGAVSHLAHMTGVSTEDAGYLMYNPDGIVYNLKGLLLGGVLIGCLGAVMDVSMSVASSVFEVHKTSGGSQAKSLFKSGMSVGCDVIGTMSNTLILAYTGSALLFILVLMSYGISFTDMLNHEFVMAEVLRALAGSIGMVIAVPGTALVSSFMIAGKK